MVMVDVITLLTVTGVVAVSVTNTLAIIVFPMSAVGTNQVNVLDVWTLLVRTAFVTELYTRKL